MSAMKTELKYEDDILKHLTYMNSTPAILRSMRDFMEAINQAISRASDEIIKLRDENRKLKLELKALRKNRG